MALTTKRIIALPTQAEPQNGDYLAIDNAQDGTKKVPVDKVGAKIDDTLTEAGKAADAKTVGDALDEIRSQAEATDDAIDEIRSQIEVTGTASGAIATFADGADMPAKSVIVNIEPQQSGTGTPSPDNIRPISGWTEVEVIVSPTEDEADGTTTTIPLGRTVYGADAEIVGGSLTDKMGMVDLGTLNWTKYNVSEGALFRASIDTIKRTDAPADVPNIVCSNYPVKSQSQRAEKTISQPTNNSAVDIIDSTYADAASFKSAMSGVQLVYELHQPQTYQLTPTEVKTLLGENNVWADSGDVEVVYIRDLNIAINNLLNSNGTRSLGMMAMSAPTEATAEELTDEQSDDDMR